MPLRAESACKPYITWHQARWPSRFDESVILALAIACRRPPEWVSGLSLDDAIRLAEAVFGANADFFIRRVVPEITRVSLTIGTLIPGQTPLPGSSDPATATPTS